MHARAAVLVLVLLLSGAAPAPAAGGTATRFHLAAGDGSLYYTVDQHDPQLAQPTVRWRCPSAVPGSPRCASSANYRFYSTFGAASKHAPITWTAEGPLRVHLAADVEIPADFTLHMGFLHNLQVKETAALTQVSPGVWEGATTGAGTFDGSRGNRIYLVVKTEQQVPVDLTLHLAGRSWIDAPAPVTARGVPELVERSPDSPSPAEFSTPARTYWFNDDQWEVFSYAGDLSALKTFAVPLPRDAAAVLAWVELGDGPFVHRAVREGEVDERRLTDAAIMRLIRGGNTVAEGPAQYNQQGRTSNGLATTLLRTGAISLEVKPRDMNTVGTVPGQDAPYTVHVLAIYGERTLARARWRFEPTIAEPFIPAKAAGGGTCVNPSEAVPTTAAVTTFDLRLTVDSAAPTPGAWTIGHSYPNGLGSTCGELSSGTRLRITAPGLERVWVVGPTPNSEGVTAGYRDTAFELDVRFAYEPGVAP